MHHAHVWHYQDLHQHASFSLGASLCHAPLHEGHGDTLAKLAGEEPQKLAREEPKKVFSSQLARARQVQSKQGLVGPSPLLSAHTYPQGRLSAHPSSLHLSPQLSCPLFPSPSSHSLHPSYPFPFTQQPHPTLPYTASLGSIAWRVGRDPTHPLPLIIQFRDTQARLMVLQQCATLRDHPCHQL